MSTIPTPADWKKFDAVKQEHDELKNFERALQQVYEDCKEAKGALQQGHEERKKAEDALQQEQENRKKVERALLNQREALVEEAAEKAAEMAAQMVEAYFEEGVAVEEGEAGPEEGRAESGTDELLGHVQQVRDLVEAGAGAREGAFDATLALLRLFHVISGQETAEAKSEMSTLASGKAKLEEEIAKARPGLVERIQILFGRGGGAGAGACQVM